MEGEMEIGADVEWSPAKQHSIHHLSDLKY
ncbi:hypothetical protein NC653_032094 [Populus alba x Populus x berolinensis]|uniref:Uncharacterized protein n=1 Tax=Populus alba x Populus x berolinensis TaxID=444605 RepID=A0AAD6PZF2_9ROSI|nr:hypothetical protein NC653_032094 [Populus alba x Populus x berolinensis]